MIRGRSNLKMPPNRLSIANINVQNKDLDSVANHGNQYDKLRNNTGVSSRSILSPRKAERNNPTQMKSIDTYKSRQYMKQQMA